MKRRNYVMQSRPKILTILRLGASSTLLALLGSELRAPVDSLNHPDHSLEFCLESSQIKGLRQHIRHLTTGTSLESHTQEASEEILLVDEVDVFFGEDCCIDVTCCARLQRSELDLSLLLDVFPHVRVRFEFRACVSPKRPFHFQPLHLYRIIFWCRFSALPSDPMLMTRGPGSD